MAKSIRRQCGITTLKYLSSSFRDAPKELITASEHTSTWTYMYDVCAIRPSTHTHTRFAVPENVRVCSGMRACRCEVVDGKGKNDNTNTAD